VALLWLLALAVPAIALGIITIGLAYGPRNFYDFHIFWHAGRQVLNGVTPYPAITAEALRNQNQFVYPAPAAVAMVPLSLLPLSVAATIFIGLNVAAVFGALRLVGVRDWRCYALAFCSLATLQSVVMGTFTPLLLIGAAVAWRYRDRRYVAASALAALIVVKLFLAPLVVWLWVTGRRTAAVLSLVIAAAATLIAWAVIGFHGFTSYPHLLSAVSQIEQHKGFSVTALAAAAGIGPGAGRWLAIAVAAGLCLIAWRSAGATDGDRKAFSAALVAGLALSPIVWLNYFMLLLLPIGLRRPRLAPLWLVMLTPWVFANANTEAPLWKVVAFTAAAACVLVVSLTDRGSRPTPDEDQPEPAAEVEVIVQRPSARMSSST
jgi:hypothetical protein